MIIVGFGGYAGSGKNTAAEVLIADGWVQMAFADPIREAMYVLNPLVTSTERLADVVNDKGWDGAKNTVPEIRRLLQIMGTEVARNMWSDSFWVDLLFRKAEESGVSRLVITDVRFANEMAAIRDKAGTAVWVQRDGSKPVNDHLSDNLLSRQYFDNFVNNNSTKLDLWDAVVATCLPG